MFASMLVVVALSAAPETKPNPEAKPKAEAAELHAIEEGILRETNRVRRRHGLRPLRLDHGLLSSARRHTRWMTRRQSLQHTSAPVAENIAMGQHTAKQVLNDWMNSPGHRANILSPSYTEIGVGYAKSRTGVNHWTQMFIKPLR